MIGGIGVNLEFIHIGCVAWVLTRIIIDFILFDRMLNEIVIPKKTTLSTDQLFQNNLHFDLNFMFK